MFLYTAFFVVLLVSVVLFFLFESFFGGLGFTTSRKTSRQIIDIIKSEHLEKGIIYDLGSARGGFISKIARGLPNARVYGVDDSVVRNLIAKIRTVFLKNITFTTGNILKANVSAADIIYLYLPQELMFDLQTKLQRELKPGATIITNKISFPTWEPVKRINELFIYAKE